MTKKELLKKIKLLEIKDNQTKKEVVCSLIGHSRIQTAFFGYFYCGRCKDQLGDALASIYPQAKDVIIVGHDCDICRKNYESLTWKDKYLCPDPFKAEFNPFGT